MNFRDSLIDLLRRNLYQSPTFGAEIGVHRGRTSKRLLLEFPRLHLYMVDLWAPYAAESEDQLSRLTADEQQIFYHEALDQVEHSKDRVEVLRMDSVEAVPLMQPLEFAFVDADHSPDGCRRDLQVYWEIVRVGGILCGHDYDKDDLPGVKLAVDEFAEQRGLTLNLADGNIFWFRKS